MFLVMFDFLDVLRLLQPKTPPGGAFRTIALLWRKYHGVRRKAAPMIGGGRRGSQNIPETRDDQFDTKEYQILELLSLRKGSTLTKEVFLNNLRSPSPSSTTSPR
jgi:hypothetical protein